MHHIKSQLIVIDKMYKIIEKQKLCVCVSKGEFNKGLNSIATD